MKCTECGRPIKPVVAVDIDGTLGKYHKHFLEFAEGYFGKKLFEYPYDGSTDLATFLSVSKEQYRACKLAYRQGGLKRTMPIYEDAQWFCKRLMEDGFELWLTTTRPYLRLDNVDPDTREWLVRNGILYHGLLYDEDKYQRLIEIVGHGRIIVVLEDLADKYDRAEQLGLNAVLMWRLHNIATPRDNYVKTFREAVNLFDALRENWRLENGGTARPGSVEESVRIIKP